MATGSANTSLTWKSSFSRSLEERNLRPNHHPKTRWLVVGLAAAALGGSAGQGIPETAPAYFRKLIDAGKVRFEFYDPRAKPKRHPGYTGYELWIDQNYSYRYTSTRRGPMRDVTIRATPEEVTFRLSHTIYLPKAYESAGRWDDPLVGHEFDHVAISVDPRLKMLADHLLRRPRTIYVTVPRRIVIDDKFVRAAIDEAIAKPVTALNDLLEAHQQLFDQVTRHGAKQIPSRKAFFRSLYTKSLLERAKFAYTSEVLDLLASEGYRKAELPHAWGEPEKKAAAAEGDPPDKGGPMGRLRPRPSADLR